MAIVGLTAGDRPTDAALLRTLAAHRAGLTKVGDALLQSGPGAKIDLRKPGDTLVTKDQEPLAAILRAAKIDLAEYDLELGGVAFAVYSAGISISGAETGLLYLPPGALLPNRALPVQNMSEALEKARREQPSNREVDALFIHKVDERWALYLETF